MKFSCLLFLLLCWQNSFSQDSQKEKLIIHFKESISPSLKEYSINEIDSISFGYKPDFISDKKANSFIKELWIPELQSKYGKGCYVSSLSVSDTSIRMFICNHEGVVVAYLKEYDSTFSSSYFAFNAVTPILDWKTLQNVGYAILDMGGGKYANSGMKFYLNSEHVEEISNSPTIKSIVEDSEQIVLLGDSKFGNYWANCLPDLLMGLTNCQVLNCGFGGCRMAWRTEKGTDASDYFSFSSICESIMKNNFEAQYEHIPLSSYRYQLDNLNIIDSKRKITFIINYVTNDITGSTPLGEYYDDSQTAKPADRSSLCGAMSYGVLKLRERFPQARIIFLSPDYRLIDNESIESFKNSRNLTVFDYYIKEKNNSKFLGCEFVDSYHLDFRNAETINEFTVDGTHFNGKGFSKYALFLYNVWKFSDYQ